MLSALAPMDPVPAVQAFSHGFLWIPNLAALSKHLKNVIPWPTISNMTGHLESMKDWVALIPVALITIVAYHVVSYPSSRKEAGRALMPGDRRRDGGRQAR